MGFGGFQPLHVAALAIPKHTAIITIFDCIFFIFDFPNVRHTLTLHVLQLFYLCQFQNQSYVVIYWGYFVEWISSRGWILSRLCDTVSIWDSELDWPVRCEHVVFIRRGPTLACDQLLLWVVWRRRHFIVFVCLRWVDKQCSLVSLLEGHLRLKNKISINILLIAFYFHLVL